MMEILWCCFQVHLADQFCPIVAVKMLLIPKTLHPTTKGEPIWNKHTVQKHSLLQIFVPH